MLRHVEEDRVDFEKYRNELVKNVNLEVKIRELE